MAKESKSIPFRIFVKDTVNGETYAWEDLTEKEREKYRQRMSENLSRRMSDYYSNHLDQFERL